MTDTINRRVVLAKRPEGELQDGDLVLEEAPIPALAEGELLIQVMWLSLDPYMRPRMSEIKGYAEPIGIGEVIVGGSLGRVIASKTDKYAVGDIVTCYTGWQEYCVVPDSVDGLNKVVPNDVSLSAFLGSAGMPGRTAYCGLTYLGKPKANETVVVSAAAGAVGSVVGQLAKLEGCRAVGIAGGDDKCRYLTDELGFDAAVDYKSSDFSAELKVACPDGIDVYFENVGGDVAKAVAQLLNPGARVPICGYVSAYNAEDLNSIETPMHIFGAMDPKPEHRFFLVGEWQEQHDEHTELLAELVKTGQLKYRETVAEGLENAAEAFKGMLRGKNLGKQLVHIAD
ncbi:MAG: NADP-dependent oxidoreductase [Kordiimonadaceae bacterium]|nr:NADP-dependent oxidoreductase [Kordiimonadaceae bacterium]MBO6569342.1 NADP-dependent oxidoreductase [Kordiimonadaceae bacterium]MBO6964817.1 NADP-dependent oxidoreductase [Kordiimonadaceae bacterium]